MAGLIWGSVGVVGRVGVEGLATASGAVVVSIFTSMIPREMDEMDSKAALERSMTRVLSVT